MAYAGATADLEDGSGRIVVVDIGGGSTEVTTKVEGVIRSYSMDIGCVRLTERFLRGDPPGSDEVAAAVAAIASALDAAEGALPELARGDPVRLVGLAGTVSTLASLELGLVATNVTGSTTRCSRWRRSHGGVTCSGRRQWPSGAGAPASRPGART